jgi:hypothetical protein
VSRWWVAHVGEGDGRFEEVAEQVVQRLRWLFLDMVMTVMVIAIRCLESIILVGSLTSAKAMVGSKRRPSRWCRASDRKMSEMSSEKISSMNLMDNQATPRHKNTMITTSEDLVSELGHQTPPRQKNTRKTPKIVMRILM